MPGLLPAQWKNTLERIKEKAGRVLDTFTHAKLTDSSRESITEDVLPEFLQFGGPLLDMRDTADELIVTAEVPGLKKDDFSLELIGRRLMIRGEKKTHREQKRTDGSYLSECSYGSFARSVKLPYDVQESEIKADLKDGLLTIRMPKTNVERKESHRLTIT